MKKFFHIGLKHRVGVEGKSMDIAVWYSEMFLNQTFIFVEVREFHECNQINIYYILAHRIKSCTN